MKHAGRRQHTSSALEGELEAVRERIMGMGGLVEAQLAEALHALVTVDATRAMAVVASDPFVDRMEMSIDDECARILARKQLTAGDLRLLHVIIKAVTDLERMGDETTRIARMTRALAADGGARPALLGIEHLGELVLRMVRRVFDAFARLDVDAAQAVLADDVAVNREHEALLREGMTYMLEDPRSIEGILDLMWSIRALERIGDHAQNIAEYVIYMVRGTDVRHLSPEQIARELHRG